MLKKALFAAAFALGFTLSFAGSDKQNVAAGLNVQSVAPAYAECDPWSNPDCPWL